MLLLFKCMQVILEMNAVFGKHRSFLAELHVVTVTMHRHWALIICMSRTSGLMCTLGRVQAACFTLSTCMHIIDHAVGLAWGWGKLL